MGMLLQVMDNAVGALWITLNGYKKACERNKGFREIWMKKSREEKATYE